MPFWVTWFLIGAFVTGAAAYSVRNNSSVAAMKSPPPVEQHLDDIGQAGNGSR